MHCTGVLTIDTSDVIIIIKQVGIILILIFQAIK